jgi:hypothetical protein
MQLLHDWPWQDVFLEVDRLSRLGHLTVSHDSYLLKTTLHAKNLRLALPNGPGAACTGKDTSHLTTIGSIRNT